MKIFFLLLIGILCPSFVLASEIQNQTEIINRRIAEEEKNIAALNKQYETVLKQKQKLDACIKDKNARKQKQSRKKQPDAPVVSPAAKKIDTKQKVEKAKEADFLKEQKSREAKLAEEERARKLKEADNRKHEQERRQHEAQVKRETVKRDAQLQLQEAARKKEERKCEAQRQLQEKSQKREIRRQSIIAKKEQAALEKQQRSVMEFYKKKQEEERQEQKREQRKSPVEARQVQQKEWRVPQAAENRKAVGRNEPAAEMSKEERARRQEKVSNVLDRVEQMDAWVKDKLW